MVRAVVAALRRYQGLGAVHRAARAAIVMPGMFAIGDKVIGDPTVATFAAFGSFAMILLVNFGGSLRERLEAQVALSATAAAMVCLGTLVSRTTWLAVVTMAAVAFGVLFAGVVSSVFASATTALLLAFILPVSLAAAPSAIPARLEGWGLACGAALLAMVLLWPARAPDPLRMAAAAACRTLSERIRSNVAFRVSGGVAESAAGHDLAVERAKDAVAALHRTFLATPYRPTGLGTAARTIVRLVDELNWLDIVLTSEQPVSGPVPPDRPSIAVKQAAATVLAQCAELLECPDHSPDTLREALVNLHNALEAMEVDATFELPVVRAPAVAGSGMDDDQVVEFVTSLDPSFRAQELSFAVALIGRNVDRTVAAERRGWWQRLLGQQPDGVAGPLAAARERAGAHLEPHSVWLHNSVRGAAALATAVLIADLSGVQHSFWVVLGTLSVLRSNALNTGQNALRGVLGTTAGFALGALLLKLIGTDPTLLWILLPIVVLFAGIAPALVSFAAGQAAFTLTLVILYNIVQPVGWRVGLLRVEDVALGCAVSVAVGTVFWPRGAAATLRTALAEAYADSATYLHNAVIFGANRCDAGRAPSVEPTAEALLAAASSRRLDDTFRSYLAENGPKHVSLAEITSLVTGVAALRLAADAIVDLWESDHERGGDRAAAREELLTNSAVVRGWYADFANSLLRTREPPVPLRHDRAANGRLIDAVRRDLRTDDGRSTAVAVRVIWTADHLDAARRLQQSIVGAARAASS